MNIAIKRVYEPVSEGDGYRVLVDRLWPRGIRRELARIDLWAKEVAPSTELRKWFGHAPSKAEEFRKRYAEELAANPEAVAEFRNALRGRDAITFLYGAKVTEHNHAAVLRKIVSPEPAVTKDSTAVPRASAWPRGRIC